MTTRHSPAVSQGAITDTDRIEHYRWMLRGRLCEEELRSLYRQSRIIGGVYLGFGQEALSAACGYCLQDQDIFAPLIRDTAGRLAFGQPMADIARSYLGKVTGPMRGRDGNIHQGDLSRGILPMISHLGAMIPTAAGMLLARRLRGESGSIAIASIGDGAMNTGALHEGLNAAAVQKLPLVVVVANNGYSYSTPNHESFICDDLLQRAVGYGVAGSSCDGTDPEACLDTIAAACARARRGEGTQLVVARLLRLAGHGEHDDARYVSAEERAASRDCLDVGHQQLLDAQLASAEDLAEWRANIRSDVRDLFDRVATEADPSPAEERWSAYAGQWPFPPTRDQA